MKKELRDKLFCIILITFTTIYPFTLFFKVYEHKYNAINGETVVKVVDKYNLVTVNSISTFMFISSIIFIVLSLSLAILSFVEIKKNNYYSLYFRIIFSIYVVISATFSTFASFYLLSMLFMIIACHMFLIYYDMKKNKRKLSNSLIYGITYLMFLFVLLISFANIPK